MKKLPGIIGWMVLAAFGLPSLPALAFEGCIQNSPENPSLILGLLGAGIAAIPLVRARLKPRK